MKNGDDPEMTRQERSTLLSTADRSRVNGIVPGLYGRYVYVTFSDVEGIIDHFDRNVK